MSNTPTILWSQNKNSINIKICLNDCQNVNLTLDDNINFNCQSNNLDYKFSFKLLNNVKPDPLLNVYGNNIVIVLTKESDIWWGKLTDDIKFKKNIKVDWDKWVEEDEFDDNDDNDESNFDLGNMQEMMQMMQMQNMSNSGESDNVCQTSNGDDCSLGCCGGGGDAIALPP